MLASRLPALIVILALLLLVDFTTLAYSIFKGAFPSVVERGAPTAYRNLYVHTPISIAAYVVLTVAALAALAFMMSRRPGFYEFADTAIKLGVPLGLASFLTGSIWASEAWGSLWTWDPRQFSILILVLAYTLYFAIKGSVKDPDRRPLISSAYIFAAYATVPLSFIIPRVAESLHPTPEQTRVFVSGAPELFVIRVASIAVLALIAVVALFNVRRYNMGSRVVTLTPLVLAVALIALSGFGLLESAGLVGDVGRVVGARVEDGVLVVEVDRGGVRINGYYTGEPPIKPLTVTVNGEVRVTLVDNIILFDYDATRGVFRELRVLTHPVVYVNTILYAILAYAPLALIARPGGARS
jgi:heme exporter protein C